MTLDAKHILVTGFFHRNNLGDDLFLHVWEYIFRLPQFQNQVVTYCSTDDLKVIIPETRFDIVILAGGDVLSSYFVSTLRKVLQKWRFTGHLYAMSVGIPYPTIIVDGTLDVFHFIMTRAKADACSLRKRYGDDHCRYFPDLAIYLPTIFQKHTPKNEGRGLAEHKRHHKRLSVGVFLSRPIGRNNPRYARIVSEIAQSLDRLVEEDLGGPGFEVFLIPFNTFEKNDAECDYLINRDVHNCVRNKDFIHNVAQRFALVEMWRIFESELDINICMRYHAHMFSVMAKVPFFSVYTTRKVQNLLIDSGLQCYSYALELDGDGLPQHFDRAVFWEKFQVAYTDRKEITLRTRSYLEAHAHIGNFEDTLATLLADGSQPVKQPTQMRSENIILRVIRSLVKYLLCDLVASHAASGAVSDETLDQTALEVSSGKRTLLNLVPDNVNDSARRKLSDFLAALACFGLMKIPYPKYHYGMCEKILKASFDARGDFTWVWSDHQKHMDKFFIANTPVRKHYFNATLVGVEDFKGCHRSGWQYVLDQLLAFHSDKASLIFDNYVDRTFHWGHDVYKYTGLIPFVKPWCGFIHHTFDETYSPFNVPNLFRNRSFLESLKCCVGLFTLSADLATKIRVLLQQHGFKDVKVFSLTHPTEQSKIMFSVEKFLNNESRKAVQVGSWLRDNYAIYCLQPFLGPYASRSAERKRVHLQKAALKGHRMSNYFKPPHLFLEFNNRDESEQPVFRYDFPKDPIGAPIVPAFKNKFAEGLLKDIHAKWQSVEIIEALDNDKYDKLLGENIVFIKLEDASAVNTVVECIVRCTPILVNRLPSLEEVLGKEYPFFYEDMTQAGCMVNDLELIQETYKYLLSMNKKRFTMDVFMEEFELQMQMLCQT